MDAFQYLVWRSIGIIVVIEAVHAVRRPAAGYRPKAFTAWSSDRWTAGANLGLLIASLSFVYAVKTTTPANAAFLGSLTPLVTVVFARFLGQRLSRSTIVADRRARRRRSLPCGRCRCRQHARQRSSTVRLLRLRSYTISVRSDQDRDRSPSMPGYSVLDDRAVRCDHAREKGQSARTRRGPHRLGGGVRRLVIVLGTLMFNHASRHVPAVPMTVFAQAEMVFVPVWAFLVLGKNGAHRAHHPRRCSDLRRRRRQGRVRLANWGAPSPNRWSPPTFP